MRNYNKVGKNILKLSPICLFIAFYNNSMAFYFKQTLALIVCRKLGDKQYLVHNYEVNHNI